MPRTLLTDKVIEEKCPEYQPIGNPNAYFNNVGGFSRSEGIKSTPLRPPPRPARIQYLSANANLELEKVRQAVDTSVELAQPVLERATANAIAIPSAPPFERNLLAGTAPPYSTGIAPPTYQEGAQIGMPPPTYEEGVQIGIPPPIFEEVLEEKEAIPMVQMSSSGRPVEGDPSFAEDMPPSAPQLLRELTDEQLIEQVSEMLEEPRIRPFFAPVDRDLIIKRLAQQTARETIEQGLASANPYSIFTTEAIERMTPSKKAVEAIEEKEEPIEVEIDDPTLIDPLMRETIEKQRREEMFDIMMERQFQRGQLEEAKRQIASVTQQRFQTRQIAQQVSQGAIQRGVERVAKQRLEQASAVENVGVSGIQQPPREERPLMAEEKEERATLLEEKPITAEEEKASAEMLADLEELEEREKRIAETQRILMEIRASIQAEEEAERKKDIEKVKESEGYRAYVARKKEANKRKKEQAKKEKELEEQIAKEEKAKKEGYEKYRKQASVRRKEQGKAQEAKMTLLEQRLAGLKMEEGRAELTRRREELSEPPTPRTGALQARLKELESFVIPAQAIPELQSPEYQAIKETMRGKQRLRGAKKAEAMEQGLYNPFRSELR